MRLEATSALAELSRCEWPSMITNEAMDVVAAVLSGDPQATGSTVSVHAMTHDRRGLNSLLMS